MYIAPAAKCNMSDQFTWKDEFNIGVKSIDEEHKRLFAAINGLFTYTQKKRGLLGGINERRACRKGFEFFKEHALEHFADEEAYMASIDYKGLERHRRIHREFRENTLPALVRELEQTNYSTEAIDHFLGVCAGWLIGHTTIEDQAITGKQESMWDNLLEGGELLTVKRTVSQLMFNIFHVKAKALSDAYNGEKFGKGIYYRLVYGTEKDEKRQEILLAVEERLMINTLGDVTGTTPSRLNTSLLHTARYIMQRFAGRVMGVLWKGEACVLKDEELLAYEQFQTLFEGAKPVASLLFDTGEGYFSCSILSSRLLQETLGTPIKAENAMKEVPNYLKKQEEQEKAISKKKVLIVDDSATIRYGLVNMLWGEYEVSTAESGMAALQSIILNRPDLILLDYDMPVCNGRQALEMIRSNVSSANIPVIFLTSRDDAESVKGVLSLGVSGYLLKSMKQADIKARIDGFFEKNKNA